MNRTSAVLATACGFLLLVLIIGYNQWPDCSEASEAEATNTADASNEEESEPADPDEEDFLKLALANEERRVELMEERDQQLAEIEAERNRLDEKLDPQRKILGITKNQEDIAGLRKDFEQFKQQHTPNK